MLTRDIFKANDIRGVAVGPDAQWDAEGAYAIGAALAGALDLGNGRLIVGRDMRLTSPELSTAFIRGVLDAGAEVIDIGLASTDEVWYASGTRHLPGAMFTASHNPKQYNGVKFCLPDAAPISPELLVEIADRALAGPPEPVDAPGAVQTEDVLAGYAAHLHGLVDLTGIRRLTVVVDAGNGMAGHTLPAVLGPYDLDLVELFTDLDGNFPNHPANPLEPENLVAAQRAVGEHGADLALVFDGDADRCFVLDEQGRVVEPSVITALIASRELEREPGATIVVNAITSRGVGQIVAERGGRLALTKVGHTFVKAAMAREHAVFGGEHSGHFYFRDFWGADTGMLAALHVLASVGRESVPLSELAARFRRFAHSGEINSTVSDGPAVLARLRSEFAGRGQVDDLDGLTIEGPDWWLNVRPSNTEPLLRLNVEAPDAEQVEALRDEALAVIRG